MKKQELKKILDLHEKWLKGEIDGEKADLEGANLEGANLRGVDLRNANLRNANLERADLERADLRYTKLEGANLEGANLRGVDLRNVNLRDVNLKGADLDYSCLPLWCGSLSANFDDKQLKQIAYHLVKAGLNSNNATEETKAELSKLIDFANGFYRVIECGRIEKKNTTMYDIL